MNDIEVSFSGNLTADPELRYSTSGTPLTSLRVASSSRRYDRQAQRWVDGSTSYLDVTVWTAAENVAESLAKGDRVVIVGNLRTQTWTPEGSDKPRSKLIVVASEVGASLQYATARPVRASRAEQAPEEEEAI